MVQKQLLNEKQKRYLYTRMMSKEHLMKVFETTDIKWLVKQKAELMNDSYGWKALYVNGERQTILNFPNYPIWNEVLDHIDDYEECQWCNEWFPKDELVFQRKGFAILCHQCRSYLISREGES